MAKEKRKRRKKTVSEFFSTLNTNKKESTTQLAAGDVVVNPKSKYAKWILGASVFALTVTGISVPWALSSCSIIEKKPFENGQVMYEIKIGDVTHQITYKEFEDRANGYVARDNQKIIDLTNSFNASVIRNLYDEEHNAYLKFKAIIDQKNKDLKKEETVGPETYGYDVSETSDKIQEKQKKALYDAKKTFQSTLGRNWADKWLMELKTNPIYGFQDLKDQNGLSLEQIETKAIEFMTVQALKKPALARFEAADIVTDKWTKEDLNWTPSDDITYDDDAGNKQTVQKSDAQTFIKTFLDTNANAKFSSATNIADANKLAVFETKSYIPEKRKPNQLLKDVLPNFYNSAIVSSFDLAIKPGESNLSPFTFDKSVMINLFKITENPVSSLIGANKFAAILQISNYQGALLPETPAQPYAAAPGASTGKDSLEVQRAKDEQLLLNLSGTTSSTPPEETTPPATTFAEGDDGSTEPAPADPSKQLGSSKFKIFNDLLLGGEDSNDATRWSNVAALGSSATAFGTTKAGQSADAQLFNAKESNPFNIFIDLLFSIKAEGQQPKFDKTTSSGGGSGSSSNDQNQPNDYSKREEFWKKINGVGASAAMVHFIDLLKKAFNYAGENAGSSPFAAAGTTDPSGITGIKTTLPPSYNNELENAVNALSDADLAFLGKILTVSFADENARVNNVPGEGIVATPAKPFQQAGGAQASTNDINDYNLATGFWSLYKLSENTFLNVGTDGMKIFTRDVITEQSKDKIDKMILDDLTRSLDTKTSSSLLYEVKNVYEKINNEDIIRYELLNKPKTKNKLDAAANNTSDNKNALLFKYKLIKDLLPNVDVGEFDEQGKFLDKLTNQEDKKLINESFDIFNNFVKTNITALFAEEESKALDKITDLLTSTIEKKKYYEFTTIQTPNKLTEIYWQYDPNNPYKPTTTLDDTTAKYTGITNIEKEFLQKYLKLVKPKLDITSKP